MPAIGSVPLTKLRPLHIQRAYSAILTKKLSPRTVLQAHQVLREALEHAVKWQFVSRNPADAVAPPRSERYDPKIPDLERVRRLLAAAHQTAYGTLANLAVLTGFRLGELLGLRWADVDFKTGSLHVRQTCQWLPRHGFSFGRPKTYRSIRPVALSTVAVETLREHRRAQLESRLAAGPA